MSATAAWGHKLKARFQGCLAAAVAGDCLGAPFEVCGVESVNKVIKFEEELSFDSKKLKFTDDTAMARSVAQSLIESTCKFNARDMAKRFNDEYVKENWRGYGANVTDIFQRLADPALTNIYHPATTQFNGSGSYGNGGAMRVAPVALAFYNNFETMKQVAVDSARLTHSNSLGYNGALLLCCAIHNVLHIDNGTDIDTDKLVDGLIDIMKHVEGGAEEVSEATKSRFDERVSEEAVYANKLKIVKEFLKRNNVENKEVVEQLGNGIAAHQSVVTAIFCFLRSVKHIESIPTDNGLVRTILYAITMDGDTDTIATMAGAIGGAYYGLEFVPKKWQEICEGIDYAIKQGEELFTLNKDLSKA
ncbi:ADP-ribosylhydrolase ARH3-like [Antedon mediterranea]|uniref:ADP-ribosylhydrolase ARH3-like n=1 Tax=Antedon mediterranea TaxID=105859 RepID=UPI003AF574F5